MRKFLVFSVWAAVLYLTVRSGPVAGTPSATGQKAAASTDARIPVFHSAEACISCHTGLTTDSGQDFSFGPQWRATMMANAGRDPYWMAGVRREIADHPTHRAEIEDECSACHMPMARYLAKIRGSKGEVFANLPGGSSPAPTALLAADGVSCALCHQLSAVGLGQRSTFTGNFAVDMPAAGTPPRVHGPFDTDPGRRRIMFSSSGYNPEKGAHIQEAGLCAACHTLFTASFGPKGEVTGELPEQVPYLEWEQSDYAKTKSCQDCHLPASEKPVPVTPVLGEPRPDVSAHTFLGGNFLMMRIFNRYRSELGTAALPGELDAAALRTENHLTTEAASLTVVASRIAGGKLQAEVSIENFSGHKLPTAYPSRRAWLHLVVHGRDQKVLFESGAPSPDGSISGNRNDMDALAFEPHYSEITAGDQVQIYESILGDPQGVVTTGLLTADRYLKDNRLLPQGFDKHRATKDTSVHGSALSDTDFLGGGDRIRYLVAVGEAAGPFTVQARLCFQSVAYRWARNLAGRPEEESRRFTRYYDSMSAISTAVLAAASTRVE